MKKNRWICEIVLLVLIIDLSTVSPLAQPPPPEAPVIPDAPAPLKAACTNAIVDANERSALHQQGEEMSIAKEKMRQLASAVQPLAEKAPEPWGAAELRRIEFEAAIENGSFEHVKELARIATAGYQRTIDVARSSDASARATNPPTPTQASLSVSSARARLFEERAMMNESIQRMVGLAEAAEEAVWSDLANKERDHLQERLSILEVARTHRHNPEDFIQEGRAPGETQGRLREYIAIRTAETVNLGKSDKYDSMRILNVQVASVEPGVVLEGEDVRVRLQFFDRDKQSKKVYPTEIHVPREEITLNGELPFRKDYAITRPYIVPLGFREKQFERTKQKLDYFGFTVEVFYKNVRQDFFADPTALVDALKN